MTKAFTNQNQPPYPTITILKWMNSFKTIISSIGTPIRVFFTCVLNLDKRLPYKEKARESVQYTF